jgi:hypothetical protein
MNELISIDNLQSEQDRFANAIIESKGANLPASIEAIIPILAFSQAKMKAFNALSDAAKKVQDQEELNRAALESGQRWGIVHLYGQKRLGEITGAMPTSQGRSMTSAGDPPKQITLKSAGINHQVASEAERIAANPEIMEKVIADAQERGDIPTKGAVLSRIKAESYKANLYTPKPVDDIDEVAMTVYNRLGDDYHKLMKMWPHRDQISESIQNQIIDIIEALYNLTQGDQE